MSKAEFDQRLADLKIELPAACQPAGNYRPALLIDNYLYVSGHTQDDAISEGFSVGKVGDEVMFEQAYKAARDIGLAILASVKQALGGDLSRVERLVSATGVVNAVESFTQHPQVMNGFSDLMAQVFGKERGVGTRSATGVASLPGGVSVEVTQCIFKIKAPLETLE
ncbi:MAG: RidA family protein [Candidatus Obscuribacterales bacterium]|nr:RidA family protein [Candidatus Obscuribacterales bacterium]